MWLGTRAQLQLEILVLRHQVNVLRRQRKMRPRLTSFDRAFWVWLYRLWPGCLAALIILKPETVVRWHRDGFRRYWRWTSRARRPGRPAISLDIRQLIRRMSQDNPLWGAPRIHGELLKLGIEVSLASVSKYMTRHPRPPSQTWRAFLRNHVGCLASIDFFTVPTATFAVLYVFIVLRHERRRIVHFGITTHPTAPWVAQQLREAFPWDRAPRHVVRDRDGAYGATFRATVKAMGIEEIVTAPRSPWQNPYVERVIGCAAAREALADANA